MKEIKLTQGQVALVDDEDFERINKHKWHALYCKRRKVFTAVRSVRISKTKTLSILMQRDIMGITDSHIVVDHKFHNTLDNRKENLRVCTWAQNSANRRKSSEKKSTSVYKGVYFDKGGWGAALCINGKQHYRRYFTTQEQAASAYNEMAIELQGEFALLNEIKQFTRSEVLEMLHHSRKQHLSGGKVDTPIQIVDEWKKITTK